MIIRDMKTEDISQLSILYKQFWGEDSDTEIMKIKFEKLKYREDYILLSAVDENLLVGSVMGIVCEELYGECMPFLVIENMIVDKNVRKKGVGKALISELEQRAKKIGCTQIILVTEANRLDACNFYESVGFHPTTNKGYKKKILNLTDTVT